MAGEIGVGQEGVVPDQGFEESAQGVVLFDDVKRNPSRPDQILDVDDDVEEIADVVGGV